jgi:hypothetical protein
MTFLTTKDNFKLNIAKGKYKNYKHVKILGKLIVNNEKCYIYLQEEKILQTKSNSVNDTEGGTGAIKVKIEGLDTDYKEITEEIVMTGTRFVRTTKKFLRVNDFFVVDAGSRTENDGEIILETVDSETLAIIDSGENTAMEPIYTVPAGTVGYITNFHTSSNLTDVKTELKIKKKDSVFKTVSVIIGNETREILNPIMIEEKGDIKLYLDIKNNKSYVPVYAGYDMILETI